jgi:hypothetical protein
MLERFVEDHPSLCPAAYAIGETKRGSGVACRITGNAVLTGTDPSSLQAFCWSAVSQATGAGPGGEVVGIGYINCPVWQYRRRADFREAVTANNAPKRVQEAWKKADLITPA